MRPAFLRRDPLRRPAPARRQPHRLAIWLAGALLALTVCEAVLAQPVQRKVSLEYAVKATYLYKLAPFVNWPPTTFTSQSAPFNICVAGEDPFDNFLQKAVAGRSYGQHPFVVRRLASLEPDENCQIVFIGHMRRRDVREALAAIEGEPVLTVTDSSAGSAPGSIMQFVIVDGHVRFKIDTAAAARNHLSISSKLLSLAVSVSEEG
ncbi:MAG TPA: YfiR family protein [Gammaproteobacteria bacterium]|nr:YfiR family protein [Gammaproteobacteria bacterium]